MTFRRLYELLRVLRARVESCGDLGRCGSSDGNLRGDLVAIFDGHMHKIAERVGTHAQDADEPAYGNRWELLVGSLATQVESRIGVCKQITNGEHDARELRTIADELRLALGRIEVLSAVQDGPGDPTLIETAEQFREVFGAPHGMDPDPA